MKKQVLSLVASLGMCGGLMAQNQIETYSVYDVNHQDGVNVADATRVVSRAIEQIQDDPQVVDAAALNALLQELKSEIQQVNTRLSAIEDKLGIENDGEDTPNIHNGHEYVDLGLPSGLKWATCNVGASAPEEYGDYFAWGEIEPYYQEGHSQDNPCSSWRTGKTAGYNWASYKWSSAWNNITKYTFADGQTTADWYSNDQFVGDNKTVLEPADDAATQNWGGNWRMPTESELDQLRTSCTWTWDDTKQGYNVTGTNGNSIFLPAAGYRGGLTDSSSLSLSNSGTRGYYLSSSLHSSSSARAFSLYFYSSDQGMTNNYRYYGQSVRAVCESTE